MAQWVDLDEVKKRVRMDQVLDRYGMLGDLKQKGENLVGRCPIHKGTNPTQFHVSLAKNNYNCFGNCHGGGNVLDFVAAMEGMNKSDPTYPREPALKVMEWFGITFERPSKRERSEIIREEKGTSPVVETPASAVATDAPVNAPLKFALRNLNPAHPYLTQRGLTKTTIEVFGIGHFSGKGIMAGRVAIPIHNEQGELVAYAGRWPGEPPEGEGKYKLPVGFHKSLVVFNLHRAREFAKVEELIIVEGFFGCMKVWQAGFPNVAALMGSSMSEEQEALIVDAVGAGGRVAVTLDGDEAGRKGCDGEFKDGKYTPGVLRRLASRVYVRAIELGDDMQPDNLSEEAIQALLG